MNEAIYCTAVSIKKFWRITVGNERCGNDSLASVRLDRVFMTIGKLQIPTAYFALFYFPIVFFRNDNARSERDCRIRASEERSQCDLKIAPIKARFDFLNCWFTRKMWNFKLEQLKGSALINAEGRDVSSPKC